MKDGTIEKGTRVRVRTTNGGECEGELSARYVPTYAIELEKLARPIMAERITSVSVLAGVFVDGSGTLRHAGEALFLFDTPDEAERTLFSAGYCRLRSGRWVSAA